MFPGCVLGLTAYDFELTCSFSHTLYSESKIPRITVTLDSWTFTIDSYVTITAHYIGKDGQILYHLLLTSVIHHCDMSSHLEELLSNVVEERQASR